MQHPFKGWWQVRATALIAIVSAACATTTTTKVIPGAERESRVRVDSGPIATSTWRWDGREFTGQIAWKDCTLERRWEERELHITKTTPNTTLAYLLMLGGVAVSATGTALYDFSPDISLRCASTPSGGATGPCTIEEESNEVPLVLMIAGAGLIATGGAMRLVKPSTKMKDGKRELKTERTQGSCVQPRDLAELKLVLQITTRKFLTIQVHEDWTARIIVPEGVTVPRNTDLPVLLYGVPRGISPLVGRWHRIGSARIDD